MVCGSERRETLARDILMGITDEEIALEGNDFDEDGEDEDDEQDGDE